MSYYPLSIQKAIQIYGSQPELLGLILSSKVEEDRRKTEEAKLRQKEIDYLLQKEKKQSNLTSLHTPSTQSNRKTSIDMLLISPQTNQLKLPEQTLPLSPPIETVNIKKRKREIQAITTIIETKEFPYSDDYLWKNNGNTIHKKSGFKSVYYKCSNGIRGCPVNKTVTLKGNGEYLIKYRGEHLQLCNRIKRITDL
ncbi:hypothetical protein G6F57_001478 [Rhizopus arrhizus]|uniref:WRKY domain-containing protein n=1 Tax=Rhizopus oryzae TaxID=64495 RepID=A0A9P6XJH7_RHIOR|nr:hypothetical protein G6F24_000815 [Rhizopus arrhizus]KAG1422618.1 hypothetical protein G6F58_003195 [Rhizopus delemar]KAG0781229.1 hypothetical protein G6F22_009676 [Rhizopus arrhizus]KAG0796522.1 hypothetical protein G6F21_001235 [Rhizopus arrhizus]KAG0818292.1 hypothetical protein G6F20_001673 [Rhizopus arrhizus]